MVRVAEDAVGPEGEVPGVVETGRHDGGATPGDGSGLRGQPGGGGRGRGGAPGGLLDAARLARLPRGAALINPGRGSLVDEALAEIERQTVTRVLVIEDEPAIRRLVRVALARTGLWLRDMGRGPDGLAAPDISFAQAADRLGYQRFWLAEHHNMPGIASAATATSRAAIAGRIDIAISWLKPIGRTSGSMALPMRPAQDAPFRSPPRHSTG